MKACFAGSAMRLPNFAIASWSSARLILRKAGVVFTTWHLLHLMLLGVVPVSGRVYKGLWWWRGAYWIGVFVGGEVTGFMSAWFALRLDIFSGVCVGCLRVWLELWERQDSCCRWRFVRFEVGIWKFRDRGKEQGTILEDDVGPRRSHMDTR